MNQFYFKINLNKFGELKKQIEAEKKFFNSLVAVFVILLIILLGFVFYLQNSLNKKYTARKALLTHINKEIDKYKRSGQNLSAKDLTRLTNISTNRIFWAKKLVALAEKTDNKLAITHFSYSRNTLSLYGITEVNKDRKEFDLINDFINKLKDNPQISGDFPDIGFVKSYRDKEKDVEILRFQIDCKNSAKSKRGRK